MWLRNPVAWEMLVPLLVASRLIFWFSDAMSAYLGFSPRTLCPLPIDLGDPNSQLTYRVRVRETARIKQERYLTREAIASATVARSRPLRSVSPGDLVYFYR